MDTYELYRDEGTNFRSVRVRIDDRRFCVDTQDMGPVTEEVWADTDYEFWTTVPKDAWGALLMAFAKEFLSGDAGATDRLRDICRRHGVQHEWNHWI